MPAASSKAIAVPPICARTRWSAAEDAEMERLSSILVEGERLTTAQIAQNLNRKFGTGRTAHSIVARRMKLAQDAVVREEFSELVERHTAPDAEEARRASACDLHLADLAAHHRPLTSDIVRDTRRFDWRGLVAAHLASAGSAGALCVEG